MTRRSKEKAAPEGAAFPSETPSIPSSASGFSWFRVSLYAGCLALLAFYFLLGYLSRGESAWWHIDFVAEGNIYWGDDAYRYFIARSAWVNPDVYWFNFTLPVAVFADGILTTLAHGHLLYARWLKALVTVVSVVLVYRTCIQLQLSRYLALASAVLLALMPLYFFVSMSFFGESWLALLVALALYLHSSGKDSAAALTVSLMPLVRPEGIFFVLAYCGFWLVRKNWRVAALTVGAGAIYFFLIMTAGPGLGAYSGWRFDMMQVYEGAQNWYGGPLSRFTKVFFIPWLILASVGLGLKKARLLWPFGGAVFALVTLIFFSVLWRTANFEPRYLAPVMPVLAVGFAVFLDWTKEYFESLRMKGAGLALVAIVVFSTFVAQFFSIYVFDEIRRYYKENGALPHEVVEKPLAMSTYFKGLTASDLDKYREFAGVVTDMLKVNPEIKTLVVSDFLVFYFLDPKQISPDVRVVFAIFGRGRLDAILGPDKTAGYFASRPFFGRFSMEAPRKGADLMLYLDQIPMGNYPYHWRVGTHDIFLFSGTLLSH